MKAEHVKLSEDFAYQCFYINEKIYNIAKPESCILKNTVLAKGGPEAIAQGFYGSVRCQQQPGGQAKENLI